MWYDLFVLLLTVLVLMRAAASLIAAIAHRLQRSAAGPPYSPRVTVLIPAHDEEAVIAATIRSVAASAYSPFEIIVVDDGSSDATRTIAEQVAASLPNVRVLAQSSNQGKAAALNRGLAAAHSDIAVTIDADTLIAPDALARIASWFIDPEVGAVCGNVKVGNRGGWLGLAQSIDYVGGLNIDRRAQATLGCVVTVPGAMGAFRRSAVAAAGGFSGDTLTEDTDLTIALLRARWKIVYDDRAVAWTEVPATLSGLFRQRMRWLRGNLQCAWKHRSGLTDGPWRVRLLALPNLWFMSFGAYLTSMLFTVWVLTGGGALLHATPLRTVPLSALAVDVAILALAYLLDGERASELLAAPAQRMLWPLGSWAVFAAVLWRIVAGQNPRWARVERSGLAQTGIQRVEAIRSNARSIAFNRAELSEVRRSNFS